MNSCSKSSIPPIQTLVNFYSSPRMTRTRKCKPLIPYENPCIDYFEPSPSLAADRVNTKWRVISRLLSASLFKDDTRFIWSRSKWVVIFLLCCLWSLFFIYIKTSLFTVWLIISGFAAKPALWCINASKCAFFSFNFLTNWGWHKMAAISQTTFWIRFLVWTFSSFYSSATTLCSQEPNQQ